VAVEYQRSNRFLGRAGSRRAFEAAESLGGWLMNKLYGAKENGKYL
jgi:hypothetical protein